MDKPFLPRDKPKSFVICTCAVLIALLIFAPILGLGIFFNTQWLFNVGYAGFVACWVVAAIFGITMSIGNFSGRYKDIGARNWKDQVW